MGEVALEDPRDGAGEGTVRCDPRVFGGPKLTCSPTSTSVSATVTLERSTSTRERRSAPSSPNRNPPYTASSPAPGSAAAWPRQTLLERCRRRSTAARGRSPRTAPGWLAPRRGCDADAGACGPASHAIRGAHDVPWPSSSSSSSSWTGSWPIAVRARAWRIAVRRPWADWYARPLRASGCPAMRSQIAWKSDPRQLEHVLRKRLGAQAGQHPRPPAHPVGERRGERVAQVVAAPRIAGRRWLSSNALTPSFRPSCVTASTSSCIAPRWIRVHSSMTSSHGRPPADPPVRRFSSAWTTSRTSGVDDVENLQHRHGCRRRRGGRGTARPVRASRRATRRRRCAGRSRTRRCRPGPACTASDMPVVVFLPAPAPRPPRRSRSTSTCPSAARPPPRAEVQSAVQNRPTPVALLTALLLIALIANQAWSITNDWAYSSHHSRAGYCYAIHRTLTNYGSYRHRRAWQLSNPQPRARIDSASVTYWSGAGSTYVDVLV